MKLKIKTKIDRDLNSAKMHLVTLAWTADELWCKQAQNEVKFDFQVKFDLEGQGRSFPQNNMDLNQGVLYLWSKFGDPSLNEQWVIVRTISWLIHTHTDTQTHRRSRWQYPKAKTGLG